MTAEAIFCVYDTIGSDLGRLSILKRYCFELEAQETKDTMMPTSHTPHHHQFDLLLQIIITTPFSSQNTC